MKLKMVLQKMYAGYVINGMKNNLNLDLLINKSRFNFMMIKVLKNIFIFIFNLNSIVLVILEIVYKKIDLK